MQYFRRKVQVSKFVMVIVLSAYVYLAVFYTNVEATKAIFIIIFCSLQLCFVVNCTDLVNFYEIMFYTIFTAFFVHWYNVQGIW